MGVFGEIICYTTQSHAEPVRLLEGAMDSLGVKTIRYVTRWLEPDHSWRDWQLESSGVTPPASMGHESIPGPVDRRELQDLYPDDGYMLITCDASPIAKKVCEACGRLPATITNRFSPSASPCLCVGWHDIIDGEYDEPFLVDRAFFSVTLGNPGAPNNWSETERRILAMPELQALRETLEKVAGPMKSCVRWT